MMAGFISAAVTSPVDVVKTRVMKQFVRPDGTRQYKNTFDCMAQVPFLVFTSFLLNNLFSFSFSLFLFTHSFTH
jgi:hypothetical protein